MYLLLQYKLVHIQDIFFASNNLMSVIQAMCGQPLPEWHLMLSVASIFVGRDFIPFGIQTILALICNHFRLHWMHKMRTIETDDPAVWPSVCLSVCYVGGCSDAFARWRYTMRPFLKYFKHLLTISLPHAVSGVLKLWLHAYSAQKKAFYTTVR